MPTPALAGLKAQGPKAVPKKAEAAKKQSNNGAL